MYLDPPELEVKGLGFSTLKKIDILGGSLNIIKLSFWGSLIIGR